MIMPPCRTQSLTGTKAGRSYWYFSPVVGEITEMSAGRADEGRAGLVHATQMKGQKSVVPGTAKRK